MRPSGMFEAEYTEDQIQIQGKLHICFYLSEHLWFPVPRGLSVVLGFRDSLVMTQYV